MSSLHQTLLSRLAKELTSNIKFPLFFSMIVETLSHGQIMSLILQVTPASVPEVYLGWFDTIKKVLTAPSIFGLFDARESGARAFSIWLAFAIYFLFFIITLITAAILLKTGHKLGCLSKLLTILALVHSRIIFCPGYLFLLQVLLTPQKGNSDHFIYGTTIFVLTIILSIVNFVLAWFKEFIFYRIDKDKSAYGCKINLQSQLTLLYKAVWTPFILSSTQNSSSSQIIILTSMAYCLIITYILYSKIPFYNIQLMKYTLILSGGTLSVNMFAFFSTLEWTKRESLLLLFTFALFLCTFLWIKQKTLFEGILSGHYETMEKVIHFPILLRKYRSSYSSLNISRNLFSSHSLYFYGAFKSIVNGSNIANNINPEQILDQDFYINFIKRCLASNNQYRKSATFLLFIARILIKNTGNTFQALSFMQQAKLTNPSIYVRSSIENLYSSLRKAFLGTTSDSMSNLELGSYFIHKKELNLLKGDLQLEVNRQLEFWKELSKNKFDIKTAINIANQIDKISLRATKRWKKNEKVFLKTDSSSLLFYGLYLDLVRGMPQESLCVLRRYFTYVNDFGVRQQIDIVSDTSAIIVASIEKERLGIIVEASDTVKSLFEIPRESLIGTKINRIMPNFISIIHDKFLQRYNQLSLNQKMNHKIITYGKTSSGILKELEFELKVYPYLDKGINLIAYIKQISIEDQIIIVTANGTITECSSELQKILKIDQGYNDNVNMHQICPEYSLINNAFNMVFLNNEDQTIGNTAYQVNEATKEKENIDRFTRVTTVFKTKEEEASLFTQLSSPKHPLLGYIMGSPTEKTQRLSVQPRLTSEMSGMNLPREEEVKQICEKYQQGGKIKLYPYDSDRKRVEDQMAFKVCIKPYFLEGRLYKVIQILNPDSDISSDNGSDSFPKPSSPLRLIDRSEMKNKALVSGDKDEDSTSDILEEIPLERVKKVSQTEKSPREPKEGLGAADSVKLNNFLGKLRNASLTQRSNSKEINHRAVEKQIRKLIAKNSSEFGSSQKSVPQIDFKLIKRLNDVFEIKENRPSTRISVCLTYIILLMILTSVFIHLTITQQNVDEIQKEVEVIDTASLRLNRAITACEWLLMFYSRLLGLRPFFSVYGYSRKYIFNVTSQMSQINKKLRKQVELINNEEILAQFLQRDMKFYDEVGDNLFAGNYLDTFTASNFIILQNSFIGNFSGLDEVLVKRPEFIRSINNTLNDYLFHSEDLIEQVYSSFKKLIKDNINQSKQILLLEHLGLIMLCLCLVTVAKIILRSYTKIFDAIAKTNSDCIKERIHQIKSFQDILEAKLHIQVYLENKVLNTNKHANNRNTQNSSVNNKRDLLLPVKIYSNNRLVFDVVKYLFISFLFIIIMSGLFLGLFLQSLSSFNSLDRASQQIYVIDKLNYQNALVIANFYFCIIFQNHTTMLVRNQPATFQLEQSLVSLSLMNEKLLAAFTNSEKDQDPVINGMLKDDLCSYIGPETQSYCEIATEGNTFGLLGLNAKALTVSTQYIDLYKMDPNTENAKKLLKPYYDIGVAIDRVIDASFDFLISYILNKFNNETSELKNNIALLSWGVAVIIIITGISIQRISIQRLINLDGSQRKIFKVLTYYVFNKNKALSYLLQKEFKSEVQGLNKILFE